MVVNFDIHSLINELMQLFKGQTAAKDLLFKVSGLNDLPRNIIGDEMKLRIVLMNLIGNAVKFTQKGSISIRFSIKKQSDSEQLMIIEVEDTGEGIAAEELGNLFKYFEQTESGKKSKSGTGLGLAISQDYVKLMGGEIFVTSHVGIGSIFRFGIKFTAGSQETLRTESQPQHVVGIAQGQKIPRILVAEDSQENRFLLVKLLKSVGLEVSEVVNGQEAVEFFEEWHPDLIFMDIRMPVMDGLEATRLIKANQAGGTSKIVALSAHVLEDEREEIRLAGCDDFVGKPFRFDQIFSVMANQIGLNYVYKDEQVNKLPSYSDNTQEFYNKQIETLPSHLIVDLQEAILTLDTNQISGVIEKITQLNRELGQSFRILASTMDYTRLLAISRCNKNGRV